MLEGTIYKIQKENDVYVGSCTVPINSRFAVHKAQYKYHQQGKDVSKTSSIHVMDGGKCEVIEKQTYKNKKEMKKKEQYWIDELLTQGFNIVNKNKAYVEDYDIYFKEYRNKHKDKMKEYQKEYRELNKEILNKKRKQKVECECGEIISKGCLSNHRKSRRHKENLGLIKPKTPKHSQFYCKCGSIITKQGKYQHYRTNKHLDYIKNNTLTNEEVNNEILELFNIRI